MNDTEQLVALVYGVGLKVGASPEGSRSDCPFCDDRIDLCRAWLTGYSTGRLARDQGRASKPDIERAPLST